MVSAGDYSDKALNPSNVTGSVTFQHFRIRYANYRIYDYSPYYTHTVQYCRFENCTIGAYACYTTINMVNNEICNVTYAGYAGTGGSGLSMPHTAVLMPKTAAVPCEEMLAAVEQHLLLCSVNR